MPDPPADPAPGADPGSAPDLPALGIHRIPVPIPFPQAGGPVNAYAVEDEDGGLLLVDAGYGSDEATAALSEGVRALGRGFGEVRRILVTHGHVDHYGGVRFVEERSGRELPVFGHPADVPKMAEAGWRWKDIAPGYAAHLRRLGAPPEALAAIAAEGERGFRARRIREVRPIEEGARLRTRHLELEVLHMPGHTPGLVCLLDRRHGVLFSNDHLLERISPNPLIELGPDGSDGFFRPLVAYMQSLSRTRELPVQLVLPGHGPPFAGHRQVIDTLRVFYRRRQERILAALEAGPRSPFEIAGVLFKQLRPGDAFLVLSEVIANLEVLEVQGAVAREERDGVRRYRAVGKSGR
ncbi:MAG TPA: MBL fold metallo-hydrolase [Anaeromyxobacter sp.]|nr:MBL fold metallo-hydrolase [Anaeromyxobacter sp.]